MRRLTDAQFAYLILLPVLALILGLSLYPIANSLYLSFTNARPPGILHFVGFANYIRAFNDPQVLNSIHVSLTMELLVVLGAYPLSLGLGLLMNEGAPGVTILRTVVILPWAISEFVVGVIWSFILSGEYGILNGSLYLAGLIHTYQAWLTQTAAIYWVSLVTVWFLAPLGAYFFLTTLQTIPHQLYQMSKIDGASIFSRFRNVTWPYLRFPSLIILFLITAQTFQIFNIIYFITGGGPGSATQNLTYEIFLQEFRASQWGYSAAISYILVLIVTLISLGYFFFLTRRR